MSDGYNIVPTAKSGKRKHLQSIAWAESLLTDVVADKVQALFHEACVLIVEVRLSDYGPVQLGDESDDLRQAVQGFERFLRACLGEARRANPGKIVRLNLK